MKEVVYAWYPPAIDAYKSNRETELDSYTKECLYRYGRSRFQDPRQCCVVREETTGQGQRKEETSGKGQRDELPANGGLMEEVELKAPKKISFRPRPPSGSLPLSVRSKSAVEGKPEMVLPEEIGSCRRLQRVGSSMQATRGRASSAWVKSRGWLAETSTSCGVTAKDLAPEGTSPGSVQAHQAVPSTSSFRLTGDGHAARVQSAVIRRQGSQVVKRSVQSAGPERQTSATFVDPSPSVVWGSADREEHIRRRTRPSGPTPRHWRVEDEGEGTVDAAADGLGMEFHPLDYDEQVKIHGWKMEIPGDPLRIKRGCLAKRLSTTIVLPLEEVSRKPGRNHMQSSDTFFYNTMPRLPMTFTIHPDWPSEILQTKRMELKAKTGADGGNRRTCRMADFSFVY